MRRHLSLALCVLSLSLGGFVEAEPAPESTPELEGTAAAGWIVQKSDFICGISDARKISSPARIDYTKCMDETEPIKEMKKKKIDPDSVEGKALRNRARTLVTRACDLVRKSKGYCGVWKVIRHSDGRIVPDITEDVQDRL